MMERRMPNAEISGLEPEERSGIADLKQRLEAME